MSRDRKEGRRANRRAFRPTGLDGLRLEARVVLSGARHAPYVVTQYLLTHPSPRNAQAFNRPQHYADNSPPFGPGPVYDKGIPATQVARGGSSVIVAAPDSSRFRISLTFADNQFDGALAAQTGSSTISASPVNATAPIANSVQPQGTVRAYAMPGGAIGLIVDGSTQQMQLTIDPLPFAQRKGYAHSFAYGEAGRSHILNIGSIQVNSGQLAAILGYHSADLSGPVTVGGPGTVDRIAFHALLPGAAIGVGGTLNTLDVLTNATLSVGPGVSVGRDLNLLNVGQDLTVTNGANFTVGRFLGVTPQPPKGTSTGSNILSLNQALIGTGVSTLTPSVSGYIQGNLVVGPGSVFRIASGIGSSSVPGTQFTASPLLINGSLAVVSPSQIEIPGLLASTTFNTGNFTPANLVARNGIIVNGVPLATANP